MKGAQKQYYSAPLVPTTVSFHIKLQHNFRVFIFENPESIFSAPTPLAVEYLFITDFIKIKHGVAN